MKLIVITTEHFFDGESDALNLLFDNGMELLHLRKPDASELETAHLLEQIQQKYHPRIVIHDHFSLTTRFHLKGVHFNRRNILLYNSVGVETVITPCKASAVARGKNDTNTHNSEGVELLRSSMIESGLRTPYCASLVRGYQCLPPTEATGYKNLMHLPWLGGTKSLSCHTLEELQQHSDMDYLFLSPIFNSISKHGYTSRFPESLLYELKAKGVIHEKIIALGGVNRQNIGKVKDYGFGGAAVLGGLWEDFHHQQDADMLLTRFKELQHAATQ